MPALPRYLDFGERLVFLHGEVYDLRRPDGP